MAPFDLDSHFGVLHQTFQTRSAITANPASFHALSIRMMGSFQETSSDVLPIEKRQSGCQSSCQSVVNLAKTCSSQPNNAAFIDCVCKTQGAQQDLETCSSSSCNGGGLLNSTEVGIAATAAMICSIESGSGNVNTSSAAANASSDCKKACKDVLSWGTDCAKKKTEADFAKCVCSNSDNGSSKTFKECFDPSCDGAGLFTSDVVQDAKLVGPACSNSALIKASSGAPQVATSRAAIAMTLFWLATSVLM